MVNGAGIGLITAIAGIVVDVWIHADSGAYRVRFTLAQWIAIGLLAGALSAAAFRVTGDWQYATLGGILSVVVGSGIGKHAYEQLSKRRARREAEAGRQMARELRDRANDGQTATDNRIHRSE